jgi:hypothetical protein
MHRIDFAWELTALEIRETSLVACEELAAAQGLYAIFRQNQQRAFDKSGPRDIRIGNGKHQNWRIDYQKEHPSHSRPNILGSVSIRSMMDPARGLYGGFDFGKYGEETPTYRCINLLTIAETGIYLCHATEEFYNPTVEAIEAAFPANQPRLL